MKTVTIYWLIENHDTDSFYMVRALHLKAQKEIVKILINHCFLCDHSNIPEGPNVLVDMRRETDEDLSGRAILARKLGQGRLLDEIILLCKRIAREPPAPVTVIATKRPNLITAKKMMDG